MKYYLFIIALSSLFIQTTSGQNRISTIDSVLNKLYEADKLNGNVLIAEKGRVVYKKSFGVANKKTKAHLNDQSVFELASLTKQFTAMAVLILKEHGKLNLEASIGSYIPELSFYSNVTVRNLLNHTGGLPDYLRLMDSSWNKNKIVSNKDVINFFANTHPKLLFEPDTRFDYSNTGYVFLASIIERCSGKSYPDFLRANIFDPLGMSRTMVYRRRFAPHTIKNYALGYVYDEKRKKYLLPDSIKNYQFVKWLDGVYGDGTVNSTVIDLLKWDRALYTDKLISDKDRAAMFTPAMLKDGARTAYGFGWSIDSTGGRGIRVSHFGSWPGYVSYIERDINTDKTIIILTNHSNRLNYIPFIQDALYKKPLPPLKIYKEVFYPAKQLKKFEGRYLRDKDSITVFLENGLLYYQQAGQDKFLLTPMSSRSFLLNSSMIQQLSLT